MHKRIWIHPRHWKGPSSRLDIIHIHLILEYVAVI